MTKADKTDLIAIIIGLGGFCLALALFGCKTHQVSHQAHVVPARPSIKRPQVLEKRLEPPAELLPPPAPPAPPAAIPVAMGSAQPVARIVLSWTWTPQGTNQVEKSIETNSVFELWRASALTGRLSDFLLWTNLPVSMTNIAVPVGQMASFFTIRTRSKIIWDGTQLAVSDWSR